MDSSPSVWFAGDTDLYDDLAAAAAEAGPVDLALVPVGGWGPSLGPGHLDPVRAAEAVRRVGARVAVPVHYGTFWPVGREWLKPDGCRSCWPPDWRVTRGGASQSWI